MSKLNDILKNFPISPEDAKDLISRFEKIKEDQRAFLENNPGKFRSIEKIEAYIAEREEVGNKKKISSTKSTQTGFTSSLPEKSYSAIEATVSILKVFFWISIVAVFLIGAMATGFNLFFWVALLPASLLAVLAYAQIQLLEAFVNTAKNTSKTNALLDINNQILLELINKKK